METKNRTLSIDKEVKILKLKVKAKTMIYDGSVLFIYEDINDNSEGNRQKKWKSSKIGIVKSIFIKEGDIVKPGSVILELEKECNHPTVIRDLCAECGVDLLKENSKDGNPVTQASISMIHMVPELKVNDELAQILGKADMDRLLEQKKLVLLVDLDQTLIHTTNDTIPNNIKDVYHFQLYGSRSPWYHTRLRPGTHNFLRQISEKYELHICTFGSRRYAHMIARFLDPDGKFFSHRILSRDECFDPNSKTANLKALFPCGENMVCIIDDREDVWEYALNLIHVKPYHFFQHTGDIHAPPGLGKCENDSNKDGFDFSRLANGIPSDRNDEKDASERSSDEGIQEEVTSNSDKNLEIEPVSNQKKNNGRAEPVNVNSAENPEIKEVISPLTEIKIETDVFVESQDDAVQSASSITETKNVVVNDENVSVKDENLEGDTSRETIADLAETKNVNELTGELSDAGDANKLTPSQNALPTPKIDANGLIVIEETDDYLLYLEEILKIIHANFFKQYKPSKPIPDLKKVIPETRAKVLKGVSLVFSGIVPNRMRLEDSQAYKIARSLGASVTQNIEPETTHLVALRAGTAKVHAAYKRKNLKLVTPEWLWSCAERWEKVDERLFTLKNAKPSAEARHPPAHCRSPEHPDPSPYTYQSGNNFASSPVGGFLYTINPLMSLSSEDIETMEGEVEDIFKESDGEMDDAFGGNDEDDESNDAVAISSRKRKLSNDSSSSDDNFDNLRISGPIRGGRKKFKNENDTPNSSNVEDDDEAESKSSDSEDDETLNTKFRRGEGLPSDLDLDYNTEDGTEEDQESDGEWNVMGAALEREFLDGN